MRRPLAAIMLIAAAVFVVGCSDYRSTAQSGQGAPQPFGGGPKYSGDPSAGRGTDFRGTSQYSNSIRDELLLHSGSGR